jgi:hypothetical protein
MRMATRLRTPCAEPGTPATFGLELVAEALLGQWPAILPDYKREIAARTRVERHLQYRQDDHWNLDVVLLPGSAANRGVVGPGARPISKRKQQRPSGPTPTSWQRERPNALAGDLATPKGLNPREGRRR